MTVIVMVSSIPLDQQSKGDLGDMAAAPSLHLLFHQKAKAHHPVAKPHYHHPMPVKAAHHPMPKAHPPVKAFPMKAHAHAHAPKVHKGRHY